MLKVDFIATKRICLSKPYRSHFHPKSLKYSTFPGLDFGNLTNRKTSQLFGDRRCATRAVYALRRVTQYDPVRRSDDVISAIRNALYVDDLLLSYSCPDRALRVWKEVKESVATRGFNVTNFVTYHQVLLASILDDARAKVVKIFPEQFYFRSLLSTVSLLIYGKLYSEKLPNRRSV